MLGIGRYTFFSEVHWTFWTLSLFGQVRFVALSFSPLELLVLRLFRFLPLSFWCCGFSSFLLSVWTLSLIKNVCARALHDFRLDARNAGLFGL